MDTLSAAHYIKNTLYEGVERNEEALTQDWFSRRTSGFWDVPYPLISEFAEREHDKFMNIRDARIVRVCDAEAKLKAWIETRTTEEIAHILDETVDGMDADEYNPSVKFTPFQRLLLAVHDRGPVTCISLVQVSVQAVRELANSVPGSGCRATQIEAKRTLLCGSTQNVTIFNGPTASGKTAMSIVMATQLLRPGRFPLLVKEYREKRIGEAFSGIPQMDVARLVVVAAGATVFQHFVSTAKRLKKRMEERFGMPVLIWEKMGKNTSVKEAAALTNTIVVWIVPAKKLVDVLRSEPDVAIACVVTDEFTVDPPRERMSSRQSAVLKHVIPIATPQDLEQGTTGRSFLQRFFGGSLSPPCRISRLLQNRQYNDAQRAADQACLLDLSTFTPFRKWLRQDLKSLVPVSLRVVNCISRRMTITSHLLDSDADLLPASPENVILSLLNTRLVTEDSLSMIQLAFSGRSIDVSGLVTSLQNVNFTPTALYYQRMAFVEKRDRIVERLTEFETECPICAK